MVQMAGIYQFLKHENLVDLLTKTCLPSQIQAEGFVKQIRLCEVTVNGNIVHFRGTHRNATYIIDELVEDRTEAINSKTHSIARLDGDSMVVSASSCDCGELICTTEYAFSENGLVIIISPQAKDIPKAKVYYKRI